MHSFTEGRTLEQTERRTDNIMMPRADHTACSVGQNPLHQFPRSKSVTSWRLPRSKSATSPQYKRQVRKSLATLSQKSATVAEFRCCLAVSGDSLTFLRQCGQGLTSWCGQKSIVSVVSCRFPNSITTTCRSLVGRVANKPVTSP